MDDLALADEHADVDDEDDTTVYADGDVMDYLGPVYFDSTRGKGGEGEGDRYRFSFSPSKEFSFD